MSDAGKVEIYSLEETTWGTTPSAAMLTVAGANSITGGIEPQTVRSNVIRADYIKPDTIRVQDNGSLAVPFELQYGDVPFLSWLEGVLRSDWTAVASVSGTDISFASADNSMSQVAAGLAVFHVGDWVRIVGSPLNAGFHQVLTSTAAKITFSSLTTIATETASASVTVDNDGTLRNGSTLKSYSIERYFSDLSSTEYLVQTGLRPSGMTLEIPTGALVTGTANFQGKKPSAPAGTSAGTGAATAKSTTKTFSGAAHISTILEGGAAVTAKVSQLGLNLSSPVRPEYELGNLDPWSVGGNSFEWSGSMNVYNNDAGLAVWEKLRADTATALYYRLTDAAGNVYQFSMPAVKYTGGNPDVTGVDSSVMLPMQFAIDYDATLGFMFQVDRFAA